MPGSEKTLLIVDDEPRNLLALAELLAPFGHRLVTAHGGRQAIEAFELDAPDLVVCDLSMPICDGLDVLRAVRAHPSRSDTPFIIVTAHTQREAKISALQAGADDLLEKPIDAALLVARVRTLLRFERVRDERDVALVQLQERNAVLERLQREQRELVEFVVHDLRAPITAMQLALSWCFEVTGESAEIAEALADCRAASRQLAGLVDDLSWIGRLEEPSFPVRLSRLSLRPILEDAVQRCRPVLAAKRGHVELDTRCDATVCADDQLLRRVLDNLLDNGVRQIATGGHVRVAIADESAILVSNDGPAIPRAVRHRIFERLARGISGQAGSAGLGLYFCKRAMQAQDGDVEVVDEPPWPASFRIRLPMMRAE